MCQISRDVCVGDVFHIVRCYLRIESLSSLAGVQYMIVSLLFPPSFSSTCSFNYGMTKPILVTHVSYVIDSHLAVWWFI